MARKYILVFLCFLLLCLLSCAPVDSASEATQTQPPLLLTITTFLYSETPHRKVLDRLVETYQASHPGIQIEIDAASYSDFSNNLAAEILSKNEFDIIQLYPADLLWYSALREDRVFLDMTDRYNASGLADTLTGQEYAVFDGCVLGLSNYGWGVPAIYYRRSMLAAKGIDPASIRTQEDFRSACLLYARDGDAALAVCYGSSAYAIDEWNNALAKPMSGGLYFKDGESDPHTADRINCNCEANVWAAQWWNDFIARDHCAKLVLEKKDARESFWNGEVPFCMDEPAFISMCQEYGEELVNDIGVIPLFDVLYQGRRYKPTPNIYPMVSCISNRSEHPEEAWDFLVWMSGMDAQNIIADCGLIPANKDYSSSDAYCSDYPLSAQFQEFAAQYGPPIGEPVTPLYARLREVMDEASMKMFSAIEVDVRPILNDAFQRMKDILNKT